MKRKLKRGLRTPACCLAALAIAFAGCDDDTESDAGPALADAGPSVSEDAGPADTDAGPGGTDAGPATGACADIAGQFAVLGSANTDLPDPQVMATCDGDTVVVTSNQIPDFPYIQTSPGDPREFDGEYRFPVTPTVAASTTAVPLLGPVAIAVNGIPIYGPTEGAGGDVMALGGGFTECGGHNGPTGYHFHTFDVTGSDACRFSEADAQAGHVLFGYAFDGYPIYSGNFQYTSSYELTDESLFATDTWGAHTYVAGSGDLDECNGRTDDEGNYAYYTTETFPYVIGCYRGEVTEQTGGGGGPPMP